MSVTPLVAIDNVKKSSISISKGNTLYYGGSGEGNYTKIQDVTNQVYPLGIAFMKTYGGTKNEGGKYVCQTTDGGYIITGVAYIDENNGVDVWLTKTDKYGRPRNKEISNSLLLLWLFERFTTLERLLYSLRMAS